MNYKITPKSLILSLLHASNNQATPVKTMVLLGDLFGFTGNSIRVTTTRLLREGSIENDERGLYRMSSKSTTVSNFVNSWRMGESRLISWDGSWICCFLPGSPTKVQKQSHRLLWLMGFREGLPAFWVRPHNLVQGIDGLKKTLVRFGIDEKAELFIGNSFDHFISERWKGFLWPSERIGARLPPTPPELEGS